MKGMWWVDPDYVVLALKRIRDFLVERGVKELSIPVYTEKMQNSRELYAIQHVVFAETEIGAHLHKKYYLSLA